MKLKIGIITATKTMNAIYAADEKMRQLCDITYLPYSTTMELANIYLDNASKFDGFLFSGEYPYRYITENVCRITKPAKFLTISEIDIYRMVAKLYAFNPQIDFSRVSIESYVVTKNETEPPYVLDDIFDEHNYPHIERDFTSTFSPTLYDDTLRFYRERWLSKKVDLIVTQVSNIAERLKQENIPHMLIQASPLTVMNHFNALVTEIKAAQLENSLAACCTVQIAHENPTEEEYAQLQKALDDFNSRQNMCFVIRLFGYRVI